MIHYSKKDGWLIGVVMAAFLIPLVAGALLFLGGGPGQKLGLSLLISGAVTAAAVLLLSYPLYYQVTPSELVIRCGILMRRHISLGAVDEVKPDRDPGGAPAWSLDRLRVDYRKDDGPAFVMISPEDKAAFLQALAANDKGLKLIGDRIIRN